MSVESETIELPDEAARRTAVETFDRNLVVTAGAGTGKTTLLVDRLVHLLLRNPEPLQITEIVALTFTNKAADEIKQRLRERLQGYVEADLQIAPADEEAQQRQREVSALIRRYQLSKDDLDLRVHEALRHLERAAVGTIHSFAATLLRLYPLEAGVDPQFREDDGKQFERIFNQQWDLWLDQELALGSAHADPWRKLLKTLALDQIKALAGSLCSEAVDFDAASDMPQQAAVLRSWLETLRAGADGLSERHPQDRANEKLVRAAREIIQTHLQNGAVPAERKAYVTEHSIDRNTKGWSESDMREAQTLLRAARGLCQMDAALIALLRALLVPFAKRLRETFLHEGFISFDGLLIRARNLVRDHLRVREELKRQYRSILVDEFQDTDPIQYEILLYLAEQPKSSATDWRTVRLVPGKVFVVGDPKQSIYAFRRADIEAYLQVVERIIKAQDGVECSLTTNFRSDVAIIDVVNGVFSRLIRAAPGVQPPYIAIAPAPERNAVAAPDGAGASLPRVSLRKIVAPEQELNAEKARRLEAESLAAWLQDEVLGRASFVDARGERVVAQPRDVAFLFRKLTDIHDYLEPLRRRNIRYVVEGERHFYAAKEIIDAVNLLRAVENPHDRLALVGVLRSPLGGVTDQTIYDLHCQNLLDYRGAERLRGKNFPAPLAELYRALAALHDDCLRLPVGDAVARVFEILPLKLLAARHFHGEQAVANLEKLRQQAEILGREDSAMTFKEAVRQLQQRVLDVKEEGESVLAEENVDAVRIMSIHKAKGLEFPIVVLAGCHSEANPRQAQKAEALSDWSTGLIGMRVGAVTDLAGLYIAEKNRHRASEELRRVLYVGMTRAREHLVLSCAPSGDRSSGSFLSMLDQALENRIAAATQSTVLDTGPGKLEIEIVEASLTAPGAAKRKEKTTAKKIDWRPYIELWQRRRREYQAALAAPVFLTPTALKRREEESTELGGSLPRPTVELTPALVVGELAHRFLESWSFAEAKDSMRDRLGPFVEANVPPEFNQGAPSIRAELETILSRFLDSDIHAELAQSRVLGREVPLLIPCDGGIMEGVIDIVYERRGLLYLADYKTDRIAAKELPAAVERYRRQAEVYTRAARQALRREVAAFKLIFLRLGEAIEVKRPAIQGELFTTAP